MCGRPTPPAGSPPAAAEGPPSGLQTIENVPESSGGITGVATPLQKSENVVPGPPKDPKAGGSERVFPKVGLAVTAAAAAADKVPPHSYLTQKKRLNPKP